MLLQMPTAAVRRNAGRHSTPPKQLIWRWLHFRQSEKQLSRIWPGRVGPWEKAFSRCQTFRLNPCRCTKHNKQPKPTRPQKATKQTPKHQQGESHPQGSVRHTLDFWHYIKHRSLRSLNNNTKHFLRHACENKNIAHKKLFPLIK